MYINLQKKYIKNKFQQIISWYKNLIIVVNSTHNNNNKAAERKKTFPCYYIYVAIREEERKTFHFHNITI